VRQCSQRAAACQDDGPGTAEPVRVDAVRDRRCTCRPGEEAAVVYLDRIAFFVVSILITGSLSACCLTCSLICRSEASLSWAVQHVKRARHAVVQRSPRWATRAWRRPAGGAPRIGECLDQAAANLSRDVVLNSCPNLVEIGEDGGRTRRTVDKDVISPAIVTAFVEARLLTEHTTDRAQRA
jgi:hypothetical protein